jgi:hypothetical protein
MRCGQVDLQDVFLQAYTWQTHGMCCWGGHTPNQQLPYKRNCRAKAHTKVVHPRSVLGIRKKQANHQVYVSRRKLLACWLMEQLEKTCCAC